MLEPALVAPSSVAVLDISCPQPWWEPKHNLERKAELDLGQGETGKCVWKKGNDLEAAPIGEERECDSVH